MKNQLVSLHTIFEGIVKTPIDGSNPILKEKFISSEERIKALEIAILLQIYPKIWMTKEGIV